MLPVRATGTDGRRDGQIDTFKPYLQDTLCLNDAVITTLSPEQSMAVD
jgi:hypothetical protein